MRGRKIWSHAGSEESRLYGRVLAWVLSLLRIAERRAEGVALGGRRVIVDMMVTVKIGGSGDGGSSGDSDSSSDDSGSGGDSGGDVDGTFAEMSHLDNCQGVCE